MCILIIKPRGVQLPPLSILENCAIRNADGCGFATSTALYKSLDFNAFTKQLNCISIDNAAILHFRYATHGSICRANCHPFRDATTGVAFAHNGILPIDPINDMTDSETAFRFYFLPIISQYGLFSTEFDKVAISIIGSSKFAFININGELRTFGQFIEYDGCYYSNYGFMGYDMYNSNHQYKYHCYSKNHY